jgi:hypothetical protein
MQALGSSVCVECHGNYLVWEFHQILKQGKATSCELRYSFVERKLQRSVVAPLLARLLAELMILVDRSSVRPCWICVERGGATDAKRRPIRDLSDLEH